VEVLANDIANTQRRQQDFYVDLDNRLRKIEPKRLTVDGKEATVEPNEQRAYDNALSLFKAGDYKNSVTRSAVFCGVSAVSLCWFGAVLDGQFIYAQRDCKNTIVACNNW
jgi:hypothetical protein